MFKSTGPVESKTKTGGLAATAAGFVIGLVYGLWPDAPAEITDPLAAFVFAAVSGALSGALTWVTSWMTKHTNRTDPDAARGRFPSETT